MARVLADFHHHALWESLALLFEDRFGDELYRPIGMDWFRGGYWEFEKAWHGDAVAHQYLDPADDDRPADGYGIRVDRRHPDRVFRLLTVEQADELRPDMVICTLPPNLPGFRALARRWGAPLVVQVGNQWHDIDWTGVSAALLSATVASPPVPHVRYHQEFRRDVFGYRPPTAFGPVRSFVQCFPETDEYGGFRQAAQAAPELRWQVYGSYGSVTPDELAAGDVQAVGDIADAMRGAGVIWHAKHWSDGYGHVIHNAFAIGRPVFGYESYYRDKLAGPLWVDGVTSIDIGRRSQAEVLAEIRRLRDDPDAYRSMCEAGARRFDELVDFDADAAAVRELLAGVPVLA